MLENNFRINTIRRHLNKRDVLLIEGYYTNGKCEDGNFKFLLDDKELSYDKDVIVGNSVKVKYGAISEKIDTEVIFSVNIPEIKEQKKFIVQSIIDGITDDVFEVTVKELIHIIDKIPCSIDKVSMKECLYCVEGWAIYNNSLQIEIYDKNGNKIDNEISMHSRKDVNNVYSEIEDYSKDFGFEVKFKTKCKNVIICIISDGEEEKIYVDLTRNKEKKNNVFAKAISYYKRNGLKAFIKRCFTKAKGEKSIEYEKWLLTNDITEKELEKQRKVEFKKNIKFSIIIPLYNTPKKFLYELIDSVENQTYTNWELCFADGSNNDNVEKIYKDDISRNEKIKYRRLEKNEGISGNTNAALEMATGDYVVLADHDDILALNALFELARVIEKNEDADVIYSDEDKISMDGSQRFEPHFKPDFNIDLLCSVNYICHLFAVKTEIAKEIGGFRSEYDGAQDYDFIFRCVENARNVYHVPKVLYHWRSHINSTAENPESKLYAFEAGKKAIKNHFDRIGVKAFVTDGPAYGFYHAKLQVEGNPKVSILIPNKDHIEDLDKCIKSIFEKTIYQNYEIVIIENNSTEETTFSYYKEIQDKSDRVKVVYWKEKEFNYSSINNFGVGFAKGEYLLFLNNDIEVINGEWMEEMLGYCQREDVGIVGARLYYPDDTIQHAGVVIGFGGIAGHTFIGQARQEYGYFARAMCVQNYSAVTAACMMAKKSVFEQVGGFTEKLKVAFNDIDFCLKVRETGKLVVYNPYAELYHYESKSRGLENTPEKIKRFNGEIEIFRARWEKILEEGDPYYNPNLTLNRSDFSLKQ